MEDQSFFAIYKRYYTGGTWSAWQMVTAKVADDTSNGTEYNITLPHSVNPNRPRGFMILSRYGMFYMEYHSQSASVVAVYGNITCTAAYSTNPYRIKLTFSQTLYGGITVIG